VRSDPLDRAFQALADRTRRGVVDLLREEPRRAGDLAARLRVSPPALTRHLKVLRDSRIVEELDDPTDGRASIYRLRRETFSHLREWVDHVEALWSENLASFAAHVVNRRDGK